MINDEGRLLRCQWIGMQSQMLFVSASPRNGLRKH